MWSGHRLLIKHKYFWVYKTDNSKGIKKGVQTEMREDAEKLTKNIHEQLEHTCLRDITVVIHIIAATKSMGAKELLIEMVRVHLLLHC